MYHARINHFFWKHSPIHCGKYDSSGPINKFCFRLSKNVNRLEDKEFSLKVNLTKLVKMLSNVVDLSNFQRQ